MEMKPVNSSNIKAVGYEEAEQVMHVEFTSGSTYVHYGVEPNEHAALIGADSVGSHYGRNFRNKFSVEKI